MINNILTNYDYIQCAILINTYNEYNISEYNSKNLDYTKYNQMNYNLKLLKRFWKMVDIPQDWINDCWEWKGTLNDKGYGRFSIKGLQIGAHRFMFQCCNGPIPNGLLVRHLCDNPSCVNPNHLLIGTYQDNSDDAVERNRTCCGENHIWSKLTEENVKDILNSLWAGKYNNKELSEIYNVCLNTIYSISTGKTWKYLWRQLTEKDQLRIMYSKGLNSSLKNSDFRIIPALYKTKKVNQTDLAIMFNTTKHRISQIIRIEKNNR
jgi:hypothetical protein